MLYPRWLQQFEILSYIAKYRLGLDSSNPLRDIYKKAGNPNEMFL